MQVGLARVQALAVLGLGPHADVHVRVGLVVVQHHHVLVVSQFDLRELARGALYGQRVGATRHRQHDVEGLAPRADVLDQAAAVTPVVGQFAQRVLAAHRLAAFVFHLEPTSPADVAQVRRNGLHAAAAAGDLDHHLRGSAHDCCGDALAQRRGTMVRGQRAELRLWFGPDDAVARIEQPVAPLDQDAVDVGWL